MRRVLLPVLLPVLLMFLFAVALPGTCLADDTNAASDQLTVEQAVDLALANRNDLQTALLDVEAASISGDLVWDSANEEIEGSAIPGTNQYSSSSADAWNQIYTSDYNLEAKQKNYETKREAVKFSVYQKYYAVVTALDNADAQRLDSEQAEQKLKISETRYQLGMDTKATLYVAQQQAAAARGNYAVAQQELDQKYIALLEDIGLPNSQRPVMVRELTYNPVDIANPESKFKEIVQDSPSVWLAKKSLDLQELTRENSVSLEGDLSDVEQQQAEIAVITTRDAMLQTTRSLYYNILNIEESYNTAVESAKSADEALRVAKLMYETGMGIQLDVTAAEINANSAHQTLNSLSYQHAIMVMALEKPWAYGAS